MTAIMTKSIDATSEMLDRATMGRAPANNSIFTRVQLRLMLEDGPRQWLRSTQTQSERPKRSYANCMRAVLLLLWIPLVNAATEYDPRSRFLKEITLQGFKVWYKGADNYGKLEWYEGELTCSTKEEKPLFTLKRTGQLNRADIPFHSISDRECKPDLRSSGINGTKKAKSWCLKLNEDYVSITYIQKGIKRYNIQIGCCKENEWDLYKFMARTKPKWIENVSVMGPPVGKSQLIDKSLGLNPKSYQSTDCWEEEPILLYENDDEAHNQAINVIDTGSGSRHEQVMHWVQQAKAILLVCEISTPDKLAPYLAEIAGQYDPHSVSFDEQNVMTMRLESGQVTGVPVLFLYTNYTIHSDSGQLGENLIPLIQKYLLGSESDTKERIKVTNRDCFEVANGGTHNTKQIRRLFTTLSNATLEAQLMERMEVICKNAGMDYAKLKQDKYASRQSRRLAVRLLAAMEAGRSYSSN